MPKYIVKVSARGVTKYHEFQSGPDAQKFYDSYQDIEVDIQFLRVTCLASSSISDSLQEEPDEINLKKGYSLEDLLRECNEENRHDELIPDRQGKELL